MKAWSVLLGVVLFALALGLRAEEAKDKGKEVTLKGTLVCGKCTLKETEVCTNVLQVTEGDKTLNYYIDDKGKKEPYHKGICPANSKEAATVVGVVVEKAGKHHIHATKVEVHKDAP